MADYCNITTDLQRVFAGIESYQSLEIAEDWTSEASNVYSKQGTGYVSMVLVDGTKLTADTENSPVAGEFYYVESTDKLYVHLLADANPSAHVIQVGEDWATVKTAERDKAMQMIDAYLNNKYVTPLAPRSILTHDTAEYEYPIVRACALYTCYLLMRRAAPADPEAMAVYKEFYNAKPDTGEPKGIINQLIDGDLVLQDQKSVREVGGFNVYPYSANTVTMQPIFYGPYTGIYERLWRIQIDTAGTLGTATYKVSYDGGTNWDLTLQPTKDDDAIRFYISSGIYIRWPATTWVLNEYWDLELFPDTDIPGNATIGSIGLVR